MTWLGRSAETCDDSRQGGRSGVDLATIPGPGRRAAEVAVVLKTLEDPVNHGNDVGRIGRAVTIEVGVCSAVDRSRATLEEVKKEDFNYLWYSPAVPQDPFVYRGSLCPDIKQKIEETFLTLQNVPECAEFLKNVKSNKFVKMTSADYDVIRDLKKAKDARKKK